MKSQNGSSKRNGDTTRRKKAYGLQLKEEFYKFKPKNKEQKEFLQSIDENPITFGEGIAGTGKSFLSVYKGVQSIINGKHSRITIIRPVVEAGENLGFLPGGIREKLDPYFIPIYDSLERFYQEGCIETLYEHGHLRTVPIAFARGVTLNDFVIIDEAQNMTLKQMILLLTRIGPYGKFVINGDITQIDIPKELSGLPIVLDKLKNTPGIGMIKFRPDEVIRNPIITEILNAIGTHD